MSNEISQLRKDLDDSNLIDQMVEDKKKGDEIVHMAEFEKESIAKDITFGTGFSIFDEAMEGGFRGGDFIVISGISGQGKTSLAQTFTYHLCKNNTQCLWFSYEVAPRRLHIKFKKMGIDKFYSVYSPKRNTSGKLDWVKKMILYAMIEQKVKVVFIDHIDFLKPTNTKNSDNEAISLKNIAIELKAMAVDYNITIVLMAHLKKLPDDFREPTMQDIGYSAGIFQLADYIFIIWRLKEKKSTEDVGEIFSNYSKIKIVKNRLTGRTVFQKVLMADELFMLEDSFHHDISDIM